MLWLSNPTAWNELPLTDKLEALRKHYCTGPCGQSSSVLATREATNRALKEAIEKLKEESHEQQTA